MIADRKAALTSATALSNSLTVELSALIRTVGGNYDPSAAIALASQIVTTLSPATPVELQADAVPAEVAITQPGKAPKTKE